MILQKVIKETKKERTKRKQKPFLDKTHKQEQTKVKKQKKKGEGKAQQGELSGFATIVDDSEQTYLPC